MSNLLTFGMSPSKKEKHYANSRARRHSDIVISQKKSKKDKDTDTESVSSSTDGAIPVPPSAKKCPIRVIWTGMMHQEGEGDEKKKGGCPLRRVQLWHTIPLCFLAIVNLLLIVIVLLGIAGFRIGNGTWSFCQSTLKKVDLEESPYAESVPDTDDGATLVTEKSS